MAVATPTDHTAEALNAVDLMGRRMIRQHFASVSDTDTYDFGVPIVELSWRTGADGSISRVVGTGEITFSVASGTLGFWVYAWFSDSAT